MSLLVSVLALFVCNSVFLAAHLQRLGADRLAWLVFAGVIAGGLTLALLP